MWKMELYIEYIRNEIHEHGIIIIEMKAIMSVYDCWAAIFSRLHLLLQKTNCPFGMHGFPTKDVEQFEHLKHSSVACQWLSSKVTHSVLGAIICNVKGN